jgi:hypothetical protein
MCDNLGKDREGVRACAMSRWISTSKAGVWFAHFALAPSLHLCCHEQSACKGPCQLTCHMRAECFQHALQAVVLTSTGRTIHMSLHMCAAACRSSCACQQTCGQRRSAQHAWQHSTHS